jgi:hypothetical protein
MLDHRIAPDVLITLVHGTWGRGFLPGISLNPFCRKQRWFDEGSSFREHLAACLSEHSLEFEVSPFLWSGSNSFRARDRAAERLAEHLRAQKEQHPKTACLVIAHSHGGNVVIQALKHLCGLRGLFIATIATPLRKLYQGQLQSVSEGHYWPCRF